MAFQRPFLISLRREDTREPWGFRLDGGGVTNRPVAVQQVFEGSLAEKAGLHEGDQVIQIGRINVQTRTLSEVQELILTCKNRVEMFIIREDLLRNRKENEPLTVKAVVHSPYNSPFQLYSQDNVAETLATQACILSDPDIQPNHLGPLSPPPVIHSNVLDALREQGERGPRLNGEIYRTPPVKKKQPPPVPPKPRLPSGYPLSPPVKAGIFPGNMEQVQYQNYSSFHREEKRTTTQKTSNYEEYEEEEEEETEEEEEEPVVVTQQTKTFKSQTSFTPQQPDEIRSQQQTQQIVRTQQTIQQESRQREYQQQQQEQQRKAEIARQQQQAYEQQQRQLREQQQRQAYEQQQRQLRDQQAREQQIREQQAREQQIREQQGREQRAREQQARDQQAREQQAREQQQRLAAQQRQAYEQQQAREAYERQQRQAQQQAYEQQRQAQLRAQQPVQQQRQFYETEAPKKLTSTARVVPANLGSPVTQRRGNCPSWPPKNSSVRELPKTGFSPSFVQERGSKQFVWPPPKPEDMVPQGGSPPYPTGHAGEAWHPQETPTVSRPLVPRSPTPTRRMGDSVWPPRHTLINDEGFDNRPMPRPVARRGRFDDYITSSASSNVPPTYRVPPGTVHVNIVY